MLFLDQRADFEVESFFDALAKSVNGGGAQFGSSRNVFDRHSIQTELEDFDGLSLKLVTDALHGEIGDVDTPLGFDEGIDIIGVFLRKVRF